MEGIHYFPHLAERLQREALVDVALVVEELPGRRV